MLKLAMREPFFQQGNTHQPFMGCADTGVDITGLQENRLITSNPTEQPREIRHPREHLCNIAWKPSTKHHRCVCAYWMFIFFSTRGLTYILQWTSWTSKDTWDPSHSWGILMQEFAYIAKCIPLWLLIGNVTMTQQIKMVNASLTCARRSTFDFSSKDFLSLIVGSGPGCTWLDLNINWWDWVSHTATWDIIHKLSGENTKQNSPVIHIRVLVFDL